MSWIFVGFMIALGWWLFHKLGGLFTIDPDKAVDAVKKGWEAAKEARDK